MQANIEDRSPSLSDIAATYPRIWLFSQAHNPQKTLEIPFNEEANFVIGDRTEIERAHTDKTAYVGTLMDGQTKGFWMLTPAKPLRGRAISLHLLNLLTVPTVEKSSRSSRYLKISKKKGYCL